MQARLKDELRAEGLVRIDGYRSVLELGEDIERMLGAAILRLSRRAYAVSTQYREPMPDGFAFNEAMDREIEAEHIALARGREAEANDDAREGQESGLAPRLLLLGPPGIGKRTPAQSEAVLRLSPVNLHCRSGFFNNTDGAVRYLRSVLRGHGWLPNWTGIARIGFREALEGVDAYVLICVTDVDLLEDGHDLVALLGMVENQKLSIIVTASDPSYARVADGFTVRELGELGMEDRHTFIGQYLEGFRKVLGQAEADKVAVLPLAGSPAFLRLLLDELRRGATFETLPALIDTYAQTATLAQAYGCALDTWLR